MPYTVYRIAYTENTPSPCYARAMDGTARRSPARAAPAPRRAFSCRNALLNSHRAPGAVYMRCQCLACHSARACAYALGCAHRRKSPKLGACTLSGLLKSILGVRVYFLDGENRREPLSKMGAVKQSATHPVRSSQEQQLKIGDFRSSSIRPD